MSESAQARSAELYVLALSVGPDAISADLELLKRRAEVRESWHADEFKWEQDAYAGWTERLLLRYVSKDTGRWNKSGYYIDKVPVLDAGQAPAVYSDQEDNEWLGEADPSDPDDWSNQ